MYFRRKTADYFRSNFSSIQTLILRFGYLWCYRGGVAKCKIVVTSVRMVESTRGDVMHGSILPVTIPPPGQPPGQAQPFGPGGGELFEAVLSRGGGGQGKSKITSRFFL